MCQECKHSPCTSSGIQQKAWAWLSQKQNLETLDQGYSSTELWGVDSTCEEGVAWGRCSRVGSRVPPHPTALPLACRASRHLCSSRATLWALRAQQDPAESRLGSYLENTWCVLTQARLQEWSMHHTVYPWDIHRLQLLPRGKLVWVVITGLFFVIDKPPEGWEIAERPRTQGNPVNYTYPGLRVSSCGCMLALQTAAWQMELTCPAGHSPWGRGSQGSLSLTIRIEAAMGFSPGVATDVCCVARACTRKGQALFLSHFKQSECKNQGK